jgi:protocatechuate 3,4-dioxygenase beta subunit
MKKIVPLLLVLSVVLSVVALVGAPEALAFSQYLTAFQQVYTDGSCGTCHVDPAGGGDRNTYGTMFENQPNHATDPVTALKTIGPAPGTSLLATVTPTPTATPTATQVVSPQVVVVPVLTNVTAPTPKLTLTLNNTMDGTSPPLVSNITSAVLLDTSGNNVANATLPDNMTAQFNLSGISPGDYFIEVNSLTGNHLPTRIDSNTSDINQSVGLRLRNSVIGNISNPTYRIKVYSSGTPPVVNSSHPVVNYATGANESKYAFVIVPGNTSRIEVRVLNTSEELSNFSTTNPNHDSLSVPFQTWILGDVRDSTGAFIGNHGHLGNSTDNSSCIGCHANLGTKPATFPPTSANGWCFRCHNGPGGPGQGFVDPTVVVAANGTIAGNVTNASSHLAISGATVTANGMMATTDANGSYNITIAAGTYTVTANATGYQTNTTTGVVVTPGNMTIQDFALTPTAVPVVVPVLTTIMVSPSTATLNVNGTQVFNATALDQNNTPIDGVNITWTVDNSTVGNVSPVNATTGTDGNTSTMFTALATGTTMVNAMSGNVTGNAAVNVTANVTTNVTVPTPKLTLTLNTTMDGTSPPLVSNITSAELLDTSGNNVETATLPDNMTAQFNLSGIMPGDYFIEVNGLIGDHLPTRIDSNVSDINQSVGLRLRNSVIGNISNPMYRIKVYPSGNPPVVNSSHPVVNYATGANESIYNFVIVPGNTSRIEVRVLNTSEELSNFTPSSNTHPAGANFSSEPFQIWILGDIKNSTGAFIGNHGHLYNNTDSNCNTCHGNLSIKAPSFSDITSSNGWCFRCHYGKTGPGNGFVDPRAVAAANGTIAGMVTNASSGSALSGANVTANGMMATTDANGNYSINIAAGTYTVAASATGFQTNTTTGVVVTTGNVTTQDFALTPLVIPPGQTFNISGFKINDTNGNGIWNSGETGIGDWNISLLDAAGTLIDRTSTDATGLYQFMDVSPGTYNVTEEMKAGFNSTNATSMPVTVENMDVMNVNFTNQITVTPPPSNATFNISGFKINDTNGNGVWNPGEMGIENWNIMLLNGTGVQLANTSTNASGFYQFMNIFPGNYNVAEEMKAGFNSTNATSMPVTVENMDVMNVNFTNQITVTPTPTPTPTLTPTPTPTPTTTPSPQATFNISGFKINGTDNNGMGIENWNVMLLDDTGAQIASTMTDSTGLYKFTGLTNGTYNVTEGMMAGWTNTSTSPMSQMVTINGADMPNVNFTNMLLPPTPAGTFTISGSKVNDTNGNGVWEPGEMGIEGWIIMLLDDTGTQIASTSTDAQGSYEFTNLTPGVYNVTEEMKAGFTPTSDTSKMVTIKDMNVTDVNFLNMMVTVTPTPTPTPPPQATFTISGFKVNDTNGNGVWEPGEMGIEGWTIMLLDDKGTQIASTSTDAQGFYQFMNLAPGTYKVTEEMKEGFTPISDTSKEVTIKDMDVKDVNFLNMMVTVTPTPTPPPTETNTISGFKINDLNGNGKQDAGEEGLSGWEITLMGIGAETHQIRKETTTGDEGFYKFEDLPAGKYLVKETLKKGYVPTGSPVIVVDVENGMNSMNNNFMNRPVSSLIPSLPGVSAKHNNDKDNMD